jgi:hypothetical protein
MEHKLKQQQRPQVKIPKHEFSEYAINFKVL